MASERTPLLSTELDVAAKAHDAVYDRFTPLQKRIIVALVSIAGISPYFISESFIPTIPQIAHDLHTTGSVVNLAIGISIFSNAIGSLVWATYSGFYGRRPIYLISLFISCIGSSGVASARTVPQLLSWRVLQAFGASSGHSVGVGVISDIYRPAERGTASGIFFAAVMLGPVMAPLVGGLVAHSYSWRTMQYGLLGYALLSLVFTYFLQPETSQPGARGIEHMSRAGAQGKTSWVWVWLNPFRSLGLLRSPNILLLSLACALVLLTDQFILVPIPYTLGARYGITNEALIGALCIPVGVGNFVGSPLAGALSDKLLIKWRKRRDHWCPEDRLRAALPGALTLVPLSILLVGLVTTYVPGELGLMLNCFCLFLNGVGVDSVHSPAASYNVDICHDRSAEITAANMALQSVIVSLAVTGILPMINAFGILNVYIAVAILAWLAFGLIWTVIRYGDRMRAYIDIGFTNDTNN